MERVLVVKIASRGDLLLSAPAIRALRRDRPDAHIALLVGRTCVDVARHLEGLDEFIIIDDRQLFSRERREQLSGALAMLNAMRRWRRGSAGRGAAEVVILHRDWRYGPLAWISRIPVRRGFASPRATRFLTHAYAPGAREHHVSAYLGVAGLRGDHGASAGAHLAGCWVWGAGERRAALEKARSVGFDPARPQIAIGFGGGKNVKTRTDLKAWQLDRYLDLAGAVEQQGLSVVWLGDEEDASQLGVPSLGTSLAGKLSVTETAAVISACRAVVANDSMIMHLGEALGIPTVGVFGPTDPAHTKPLSAHSAAVWVGNSLPCSPCHRDGYFPECPVQHACMRSIGAPEVLETLERVVRVFSAGTKEALAPTTGAPSGDAEADRRLWRAAT